MPTETRREYYSKQLAAMKEERSSFVSHWTECSDFVSPRRGRFFVQDNNRGGRRFNKIINSTATFSLRTATAGMVAGSMSAARPWFALQTQDKELMEFQPVKVWLFAVANLIREILNSGNFYTMAPTTVKELIQFGTGAMIHDDDFEDVARFYAQTIGAYYIAQDDKLKVNTFAREFEMTVRQIVKKFGLSNVSATVRNAYDSSNYNQKFTICHYIEPNEDYKPSSPLARHKAFRSTYFESGGNGDKVLRDSGYDMFPVYVPRWETAGEDVYATNWPIAEALGDVKQLQVQEKRKAQGLDKLVNPPLTGPASVRNVPISALPGGTTLYDGDPNKNKLQPLYQITLPIQELREDMKEVERRIQTACFVDLFLAITNMEGIQPKNQLELNQRDQERLLQLGPVLGQIHGDFLTPLINRVFYQCVEAKLFTGALAPPPEIQGQDLKIDYISALAMAQKAVASRGIDDMTNYVLSVGAVNPDAMDKWDFDQAIDERATVIGVSPKLVRSDEVVAATRAQRAKQQQMAQAVEMAQAAANTAKMASDAKTTEPSMLTAINDTIKQRQAA